MWALLQNWPFPASWPIWHLNLSKKSFLDNLLLKATPGWLWSLYEAMAKYSSVVLWRIGQYPWGTVVPFGDRGKLQIILMHCSKHITNPFLMTFCYLAKIMSSYTRPQLKSLQWYKAINFCLRLYNTRWRPLPISTYINSVLARYLNLLRWPTRKHSLAMTAEIHKCCVGQVWLMYKPLTEPVCKVQPTTNKFLL